MKQVRVMTIFGTRPEAIKMAPLVAELTGRCSIPCWRSSSSGPITI